MAKRSKIKVGKVKPAARKMGRPRGFSDETFDTVLRLNRETRERLRGLASYLGKPMGPVVRDLLTAGEPYVVLRDLAMRGAFSDDAEAREKAAQLARRHTEVARDLQAFNTWMIQRMAQRHAETDAEELIAAIKRRRERGKE